MHENITSCRVCSAETLESIHPFGTIPLADKLTKSKNEKVPAAPLTLIFCTNCCHLQILEDVAPSLLFQHDYAYYSSKIPEVVSHFKQTYQSIKKRKNIFKNDVVIEIAANDGVLLKQFEEDSNALYSIEPSEDHAAITSNLGIQTISKFFDFETAKAISSELPQKAQLIMGNNVLAHVPNPDSLVKGIELLLDESGMAVIEVPHSMNIIKNCTFDVIFHQHYSYFSLHSLTYLFESNNLVINSLETIDTQGGSLRLFISKTGKRDKSVNDFLADEKANKLTELNTYSDFSNQIKCSKSKLTSFIEEAKSLNKKIVGYGAPGKAATLLNYFGIDESQLEYLVDISDNKHNLYFPFTNLEIISIERFLQDENVDYVIILAWNYATSIVKTFEHLRDNGTQFIIPHPELRFL